MKNPITLFLVFTLCFTFCKKKDTSADQPPVTENTNGTGGPDYGVFLTVYNTTEFGDHSLYLDSVVMANFYDSPFSTHTTVNAGTVSVNGVTLVSFFNNVYTSTNQINLKGLIWQISGSGTITAGNFSYSPIYPTYNDASSLPDSVAKAGGFTFTVNSITDTNRPVYITIGQNSALITRTLTSFPSVVNVSSSELTGFTSNTDFTIRLSMFNYSNVTFNSKQYAINANRTYLKYCYLKP